MNLDDKQLLETYDQGGMLAHIDGLPEQFETAWHFGLSQPLNEAFQSVKQIIVCGMGGSAIGGDLLGGLMQVSGKLPLIVNRGYELPAWAQGSDTLVIASSFSGNTEETITAYQQATERGLPVIVMTTGGQLAELVRANTSGNQVLWQFNHQSPPRAALGWSLGLGLALAHRLNWLSNLDDDVQSTVADMREHREIYRFDTPVTRNPAKRQAGQWVQRIPVIYGSGVFEVVARRYKTQLNENANMVAFYESLPEANHNAVVGVEFPEALMTKLTVLFLRSRHYDHARVRLRQKLTFQLYLQHGIAVDAFRPHGDSLLAQTMHAVQYGDYVSFYAALANGCDPTVITPIDELKAQLAQQQSE